MATKAEMQRELIELRSTNARLWRERNEAITRVKTWEGITCMVGPVGLAVKRVQNKEWPGEGDPVDVAIPTPERLSDILDEIQKYRNGDYTMLSKGKYEGLRRSN